jgi:hypothetical protein
MYMRSRSSLGSESRREKEGSNEAACAAVEGWLVEGFRRRTGRLGDCGGASSIMVSSEEPLLPVEERDCDRGVEVREAISSGGSGNCAIGRGAQARSVSCAAGCALYY